MKTIKDSVSRAKRLIMSTRTKTVSMLIADQQAKLVKLEERIGYLMTQRADLEERIGYLMTQRADLEETIAELYQLRPSADRSKEVL